MKALKTDPPRTRVVSISLSASEYDTLKFFKEKWGVSISKYFRTIHKHHYKKAVEGVEGPIRFDGVNPPAGNDVELPGMKSFFVKEDSFEDFELMRTLTANYENLSGFSRQSMFNTLLEVYHDFVKQRYGNRVPVIPDIDPDAEPPVDDTAEAANSDDFDDWENL